MTRRGAAALSPAVRRRAAVPAAAAVKTRGTGRGVGWALTGTTARRGRGVCRGAGGSSTTPRGTLRTCRGRCRPTWRGSCAARCTPWSASPPTGAATRPPLPRHARRVRTPLARRWWARVAWRRLRGSRSPAAGLPSGSRRGPRPLRLGLGDVIVGSSGRGAGARLGHVDEGGVEARGRSVRRRARCGTRFGVGRNRMCRAGRWLQRVSRGAALAGPRTWVWTGSKAGRRWGAGRRPSSGRTGCRR